jgi:phage protein U
MFAQLGNIAFDGLNAPQSWSETHAAKFGEITHIGAKPSLQFTGNELSTISLTKLLSVELGDPAQELNAIKEALSMGEILPLITGAGIVIGNFVIENIGVEVTSTTAEGEMLTGTLTVALKEYVAPPNSELNAPQTGSAVGINAAPPQPPLNPVTTPPQSIMKDITEAQTEVSKMNKIVTSVKNGVTSVQRGVKNAKDTANSVKNLYSNAKSKLLQTEKLIERAQNLPQSLDDAIDYADNLTNSNITNVSQLESSVNNLTKSANKVTNNASTGAAFVATKETGT